MHNSTAEKNIANKASNRNTSPAVTGESPVSPHTSGPIPVACSVTNIEIRFSPAVRKATVTTAAYFARSSPSFGTGAATSSSSVFRSRSPAVRSMAG